MDRLSLVVLMLFCFVFRVNAQDIPAGDSSISIVRKSHLLLGGGVNFTSVIDKAMSPHLYSAFGSSAVAGFMFKSDKMHHDVLARFDYAELENTYEFSSASMQGFRGDFYYFYGRTVTTKNENQQLLIGPSLANVWALRSHQSFTNNSNHNHFYSSLSAAATYQYSFQLFNRDFSASAHCYIPVLSYVITPMFATTAQRGTLGVEDPGFFDYMKSGDWRGMGGNRGLSFLYDLQYSMLNGNKLRLAYQWHYRSNRGYNDLQMADHSLTFAFMINMSRP